MSARNVHQLQQERQGHYHLAEEAEQTGDQEQRQLLGADLGAREPTGEGNEGKGHQLAHVRQVEVDRHDEVDRAVRFLAFDAGLGQELFQSLDQQRQDDQQGARCKGRHQRVLRDREEAFRGHGGEGADEPREHPQGEQQGAADEREFDGLPRLRLPLLSQDIIGMESLGRLFASVDHP
jgi:hypothetical protein